MVNNKIVTTIKVGITKALKRCPKNNMTGAMYYKKTVLTGSLKNSKKIYIYGSGV